MDVEDFAEPEVGVAVAFTAAVCSPTVRRSLRKGLVYSLAGVLMAGDAVKDFGKGVRSGLKGATAPPAPAEAAEAAPPQENANG